MSNNHRFLHNRESSPSNRGVIPTCKALDFASVICVLHQVRLHLYRKRALGVTVNRDFDEQTPAQNLEELLRAYARFAHPSLMSCTILSKALHHTGNQSLQTNYGLLTVKAPAEFGFVKSGKPIVTAGKDFDLGDKLFTALTSNNQIPTLGGANPPPWWH